MYSGQKRVLNDMDPDERGMFEDGRDTLFETCFNRDCDAVNAKYILSMDNVRVVKAVCCGKHAVGSCAAVGAAGSIPKIGYYTEDGMVQLTVNLLPEDGLFNGSRGFVVAVLYRCGFKRSSAGATAETDMPFVVVDFPGYSGKAWFHTEVGDDGKVIGTDRRSWVPIPPQKRICDKKCCHRVGVPLVTGRADSAHCCQGMSVGEGKAIRRLIGLWSAKAEQMWPGIFYVLASRVQDERDIAFAVGQGGTTAISAESLSTIGKSETWAKTDAEVERLKKLCKQTRANCVRDNGDFGSKEHWEQLCARVVERGQQHLSSAACVGDDRKAVQAVVDAWGAVAGGESA